MSAKRNGGLALILWTPSKGRIVSREVPNDKTQNYETQTLASRKIY